MLIAAAQGAVSTPVLEALAAAVLASAPEDVRLALAVREGGPHAVRRGIELAALVLARAPAALAAT